MQKLDGLRAARSKVGAIVRRFGVSMSQASADIARGQFGLSRRPKTKSKRLVAQDERAKREVDGAVFRIKMRNPSFLESPPVSRLVRLIA
jgi:hypothetical protein